MDSVERRSVKVEDELREMGLNTIKELETEFGILASGKEEIFGCIFGRDSLITGLKLLRAYQKTGDIYFLSVVKKILASMARLQGVEYNLESGEEPGKIIHEYREKNHEHLTSREKQPWYAYPDGVMKNYDSVDSTPLFLIAVIRYFEHSHDEEFLEQMSSSVGRALEWLLSASDGHELGFLSYDFPKERKCGGLATQSWMDSFDSVFHEDGSEVYYPISPVEAQGYAYLAMRLWSKYMYEEGDNLLAQRLNTRADKIKKHFNKHFIQNATELKVAFAIDGRGKSMTSKRSSAGHLLWMSLSSEFSEANDCILEPTFIPSLVKSILASDIFEPEAGIRTLSKHSAKFNPNSYHNGSIWPHDNAIIAEGLENFGYVREAEAVRKSLRRSWEFFKTPIELFVYDGEFKEYVSEFGQKACKCQAWSAASMVSEL